jgi:hypothetical protein
MSEELSETPVSAPEAIDTSPPAAGLSPEPSSPEPSSEPSPELVSLEDELGAVWDKHQVNGVDRAEDGKFTNGKEPEVVQPPPEPVKVVDPPQSWTSEQRTHWAKLPPETQEYILQRESEAHKAITSYGERVKSYEPLERIITQHRQSFERRGLDAARAVETLFSAQDALDRNPVDGLINIGLSYGIDLRPAFNGQQGSIPAADPRVGQLESRLSQWEQHLTQQQRAEAERQTAEAESTLNAFSKDKPYFQDVRAMMASFMRDGHADNLQAAYDMAVNASPQTRERIQADQRKAKEEERKAEEAKRDAAARLKAEEAQKAARLNVRSNSASKSNPQTMDDTIENLARKLYG